jgi:hypothetical protein
MFLVRVGLRSLLVFLVLYARGVHRLWRHGPDVDDDPLFIIVGSPMAAFLFVVIASYFEAR